jgi:DNA-binding HxlR family transcriptional regulator
MATMKLPNVTPVRRTESGAPESGGAAQPGPHVGPRHGRWYDDACGTAFALELVGERWSLLIVREMLFGGRRFTDLRRALPGISAKVLTERLEGLEAAGLVRRRQAPPPAPVQLYELTAWGAAAEPAIMALGAWAASSPRHDPTLYMSPASLMVSFRAMFRPAQAATSPTIAGTIRIEREVFRIDIAGGGLDIARGEHAAPQFTFAAAVAWPILALVYGKRPIAEAQALGLDLAGDADVALRFAACFSLPDKILA